MVFDHLRLCFIVAYNYKCVKMVKITNILVEQCVLKHTFGNNQGLHLYEYVCAIRMNRVY